MDINDDNGKISIQGAGFDARLAVSCQTGEEWTELSLRRSGETFVGDCSGLHVELLFGAADETGVPYEIRLSSIAPSRARLELTLAGAEKPFHLIPCCVFGDNNHAVARPNEYPTLHEKEAGNQAAAPLWEFRADRAALPVSMLCTRDGVAALSIDPYSSTDENAEGFIRNGVFSGLPASCGVSLGYGNFPLTFQNKQGFLPPTRHLTRNASASGKLFLIKGPGRLTAHRVIRELYARHRECPRYTHTPKEALRAFADAFIEVNYSEKFKNYTNLKCRVPVNPKLESWRPLAEIGWTGGGILAYPFLLAENLLDDIHFPKTPRMILDEICGAFNEAGGFIRDVAAPSLVGDPKDNNIVSGGVNGWWSGFMPHTMDKHCAYTNGHAAYYLLKTVLFLRERGVACPDIWRDTALKVLDTAAALQREDGAYGYLFSITERKVTDWEGFAGAWFAAAMPLAWKATGEKRYLESARRALDFYAGFVRDLNCWGTPMDTWKSVDQEGVLGFIQAARAMHEATRDPLYLTLLAEGAEYEFLWRYGFKARPEVSPLKNSGWNACGGSVTSISNPHIHPMGLVITGALEYLAEETGDAYFKSRAEDGFAWAMSTMELYPEKTGYGRYGVLTERYCPSDGLLVETFEDTGAPSSMWWSFNGWAAANVMEAVAEKVLHESEAIRA